MPPCLGWMMCRGGGKALQCPAVSAGGKRDPINSLRGGKPHSTSRSFEWRHVVQAQWKVCKKIHGISRLFPEVSNNESLRCPWKPVGSCVCVCRGHVPKAHTLCHDSAEPSLTPALQRPADGCGQNFKFLLTWCQKYHFYSHVVWEQM